MPFTAKVDAICVQCGEKVFAGDMTRPLKIMQQKIEWAHFSCVDAEDERIPICKHWLNKGICLYQEKCFFRHPQISREALEPAPRKRHVCLLIFSFLAMLFKFNIGCSSKKTGV
jgi:hypothetical protein